MESIKIVSMELKTLCFIQEERNLVGIIKKREKFKLDQKEIKKECRRKVGHTRDATY